MATNITGSVSLTYGTHSHSETFNTTASTLTNTASTTTPGEFHDYSAGGGRALVAGAALGAGTIDGAEGLLLIKNDNNIGALSLSMDDGYNWDVSIPAGVANLISVGPDHPVQAKTPTPSESAVTVVTVTAAGGITFSGGDGPIGTCIMTGVSNVNSNTNDYVVEFSSVDSGTVYELDGVTKVNLTADYDLTDNSTVNLVYFVRYRYTLSEA